MVETRLGLMWAILLGSKDGCLFFTYSLHMRVRVGL